MELLRKMLEKQSIFQHNKHIFTFVPRIDSNKVNIAGIPMQ